MPKSLQPVMNSTLARSVMDWGVLTVGIIMLAIAVTGTFLGPKPMGPAQASDTAASAFRSI